MWKLIFKTKNCILHKNGVRLYSRGQNHYLRYFYFCERKLAIWAPYIFVALILQGHGKDMLKVDLITGFLGSGKTTFLREYAKYLMKCGLNIGILEYDHGAVNVDVLLLKDLRGKNCEIENVSAGCDADCLRRRFKTKLIAMAMTGYDRVIIEPSGIFDMDEFFDCMRDEPLDRLCCIGNVITIVNAEPEENMGKAASAILAAQAVSAGRIVLSRTELVSAEDIQKTKEFVKKAAKDISCECELDDRFFVKNRDELTDDDYHMLSECGYRISDYVKYFRSEESFSSVCVLKSPCGIRLLEKKTAEMFNDPSFGNILRIKGFAFEDGKCYELNATREKTESKIIKEGQNVVIVIGTGLDRDRITSFIMKT